MVAASAQGRIAEGRLVTIGLKAAQRGWIRPEFFFTTVELPGMAHDENAPTVDGAEDAPDLHVMTPVLLQVADVFSVALEADQSETARPVTGFRSAGVQQE